MENIPLPCRKNYWSAPFTKIVSIWTQKRIFNSFHVSRSLILYVLIFTCFWLLQVRIVIPCKPNVRMFPFDITTCKLMMSSYAFTTQELTYEWNSQVSEQTSVNVSDNSLTGFHTFARLRIFTFFISPEIVNTFHSLSAANQTVHWLPHAQNPNRFKLGN